MGEAHNRREFTRVTTRFHVSITAGGRTIDSGRTRDLSMKGLFVQCDEPLPAGTECQAVIHLGEPESGIEVKTECTVVRSAPDGLALEFTAVDVESYGHLRNMVLLNSQETETVEKEIHGHLGLKNREGPAS